MNTDYDSTLDDLWIDIPEFDDSHHIDSWHDSVLDDIIHQIMSNDNVNTEDDLTSGSEPHPESTHSEISFGSKYSDSEIQKMESDVDMAEHEMKCRENDMNNWRSKVSLNDTKEHRANGDYDNAVRHFNEAQSKYNSAVSRYNSALSKLNNAK